MIKSVRKSSPASEEVSRFRDLNLRALRDFGSGWPDQHRGDRDGARDGGGLLGVAEIVVRVGRDGGT